MTTEPMTIDEFCRAHRLCRRTWFNLKCRGEAPETIRVGRRDLISPDAATAWRLRNGTPSDPDGDLVELVAAGMIAALPDLVQRLGAKEAAVTYHRQLGTLLQAIGLLDADDNGNNNSDGANNSAAQGE